MLRRFLDSSSHRFLRLRSTHGKMPEGRQLGIQTEAGDWRLRFLIFGDAEFNTARNDEIETAGPFPPRRTALRAEPFCKTCRFGLRNRPFQDAKRVVLEAETACLASRFPAKMPLLGGFWPETSGGQLGGAHHPARNTHCHSRLRRCAHFRDICGKTAPWAVERENKGLPATVF